MDKLRIGMIGVRGRGEGSLDTGRRPSGPWLSPVLTSTEDHLQAFRERDQSRCIHSY